MEVAKNFVAFTGNFERRILMKINVVDSIMGSGKTSAIINAIKKSSDSCKFMFITPYLTEVDRIKEQCINKNFKSPKAIDGKKTNGIKTLLINGDNIVSTHALFHQFDEEIFELIKVKEYILILDEVTDVIEPYNISKDDLDDILEKSKYAHIDENHFIVWDEPSYKGKFTEFKNLCELGSVIEYGGGIIVWLFPIKSFEAFKSVYILTYLFDGQVQKWYYDYHNVEYRRFVACQINGKYKIIDRPIGYRDRIIDKSLITICDNEKLNNVGYLETALSKSWYEKAVKNKLITTVKNNTTNWFINISKAKSPDILWTTFKDYQTKVKGNGYTKSFIAMNMRASNDYRDRHYLAYLCNRYINPIIGKFFYSNNIDVNQEAFALSEMLQWIWRSAIRDGEHISIYIPSRRMRNLLINWLETGEISSEDYKHNTNDDSDVVDEFIS